MSYASEHPDLKQNHVIRNVGFSLLLCFTMYTAAAQYPCVKARPWSCFGAIELTVVSDGESGMIGMQVFDNGDILAESRDKTSAGRKLLALGPPPLKILYKGVPDKEIQEGHPFIFFDYGFAAPILALEQAYPDGPGSVQNPGTEKRVTLDGQMEAAVSADRLSSDRIHFRLTMPKVVLDGFIDYTRKAAIPDDFELEQWKDRALRKYANAGEARAGGNAPPKR